MRSSRALKRRYGRAHATDVVALPCGARWDRTNELVAPKGCKFEIIEREIAKKLGVEEYRVSISHSIAGEDDDGEWFYMSVGEP